jgi:hypothetical protein
METTKLIKIQNAETDTKRKRGRHSKKADLFKNIDPELVTALKNREKTRELLKKEKVRQVINDSDILNIRSQMRTRKKPSIRKKTLTNDAIESIIRAFKAHLKAKDFQKFSIYFNKIKKYQVVPILHYYNALRKKNSKAPLPLLKNIFFNLITSDINLIRES